jgi:hypothetical protein
MQQINVDISASGEVKVEAKCVVGNQCGALTKAIEEALGQTTADVKKPEYFQQAKQNAQQHNTGSL